MLQTLGMLGGAAVQARGAAYSIEAARQQVEAENQARQWNSTLALQQQQLSLKQAENAIARGEVAQQEQIIQGEILRGQQRAQYGSSGVNVNTGSAAAVQADTSMWANYAAQKERYNAEVEAWGYNAQAQQYGLESQRQLAGQRDPTLAMRTAALQGASGILNTFSRFNF